METARTRADETKNMVHAVVFLSFALHQDGTPCFVCWAALTLQWAAASVLLFGMVIVAWHALVFESMGSRRTSFFSYLSSRVDGMPWEGGSWPVKGSIDRLIPCYGLGWKDFMIG